MKWTAFSGLLGALADEFATGDEPVARHAATALRRELHSDPRLGPVRLDIEAELMLALTGLDATPAASSLLAAVPTLHWYYTGLEDGRYPEEIARRTGSVELLGPDGMVYAEDCRIGIHAQCADVEFPSHTLKAEEVFIVLAGSGSWSSAGGPRYTRLPGERVHHVPGEPHACRTGSAPMIAAWAWSGDIGWDGFYCPAAMRPADRPPCVPDW